MAFLQYLGLLAWPVIAIGWMTNLYQRGMASLKRIKALLDANPDVVSPENPTLPEKVSGNIRFKNIEYSYGRGRPVLANINLDISQGSKIGISGPHGSGKTSLVQLIQRLYNADSGQILLDDTPLESLNLDFLRANIALMPQESFLFSGTIR